MTSLVHLHIPRTAGSSLDAHLSRACAAAEVPFRSGHFAWGCFEEDATVFTVLREPVERALSLYRYIMANASHGKHEALRRDPIGYLTGAGKYSEFNSGQSRLLAGSGTLDRELKQEDIDTARRHLESERSVFCTMGNLDAGLKRLSERVCPISPLEYKVNGGTLTHIPEDIYWRIVAMQEDDMMLWRWARAA